MAHPVTVKQHCETAKPQVALSGETRHSYVKQKLKLSLGVFRKKIINQEPSFQMARVSYLIASKSMVFGSVENFRGIIKGVKVLKT